MPNSVRSLLFLLLISLLSFGLEAGVPESTVLVSEDLISESLKNEPNRIQLLKDMQRVRIESGALRPRIDRVLSGISFVIFLLTMQSGDERGALNKSDQNILRLFLAERGISETLVTTGSFDPALIWKRTFSNKNTHKLTKITLGTFSALAYTLSLGRFNPLVSNGYNPLADVITLYSKNLNTALSAASKAYYYKKSANKAEAISQIYHFLYSGYYRSLLPSLLQSIQNSKGEGNKGEDKGNVTLSSDLKKHMAHGDLAALVYHELRALQDVASFYREFGSADDINNAYVELGLPIAMLPATMWLMPKLVSKLLEVSESNVKLHKMSDEALPEEVNALEEKHKRLWLELYQYWAGMVGLEYGAHKISRKIQFAKPNGRASIRQQMAWLKRKI